MRAVVLRSHGGPEVLTIEDVAEPDTGAGRDSRRRRPHRVEPRRHPATDGAVPRPAWPRRRDPRHGVLGHGGGPRQRGQELVGRRSGDGHRSRRLLRRARRDPQSPGAARSGVRRPRRRRRDRRGLPHRVGRARGAGWVDIGPLGAGPCRRIGRGNGRHPDRQGHRCASGGDVFGGQGAGLPRARRRPRARAEPRRLAG